MKKLKPIQECMYNKFCQKADRLGIIKRKELRIILGIVYRIPKNKKADVIKQLQEEKILIRINKETFKLNK